MWLVRLVVVLVFVSATGLARADVPDPALQAMLNRAVVVDKVDGSEVPGTLVGFDATTITVLKPNGDVIVIARAEASALRGTPAPTGNASMPPQLPLNCVLPAMHRAQRVR
jgi:small nuclear ribonucleoprotein (snRNP)-like protein